MGLGSRDWPASAVAEVAVAALALSPRCAATFAFVDSAAAAAAAAAVAVVVAAVAVVVAAAAAGGGGSIADSTAFVVGECR